MTQQDTWIRCDVELPPENEVVETMSEGGLVQMLKRLGRLWWTPNDSMYVYYTPVAWRRITRTGGN